MLDTELSMVHFFKKTTDSKPYQTLSLDNGDLNSDGLEDTQIVDETTGQKIPGFKFQFKTSKGKKKGKEMTVIPEQPEQIDLMIKAFRGGSKKDRDHTSRLLKQSSLAVEQEQKRNPLQKRSGINRISMAVYNAPEMLTGTKSEGAKHKNPKNIVSGLGYGGYAFAKGIFMGVTGIVYEPYKGAKEKGAKGFSVGVGKGLVGLVAKPVAGTIGMVGCTVQGTINTPGTIKKAVTKKKTDPHGAAQAEAGEGEETKAEEGDEQPMEFIDPSTVTVV